MPNGKSRRSYRGAPVSNTLKVTLNENATTITLTTAVAGWSTDAEPFFVVVDPGTAKEEKICVKYASADTLTVVDPAVTSTWGSSVNGRGADNTTDREHLQGAAIYPVFTAFEANQANELVSKYANPGSVVYQGSGSPVGAPTELAIGTANQVLSVNSGATAPLWGKIVNTNVDDAAAIALSKLATGALPSGITVASANLTDLTIATADIAAAAVTSPKLAAPTLTPKTDTFTLALVDANCTMQCNKASVMDVEIPGSGIAFTNGTVITLVNYGAGQVTVKALADSSVDVRSSNGFKLRTRYSMATLVKISDTEWVLSGDTVA
jgi:hypothetical protein